jgi:hypothetical protein
LLSGTGACGATDDGSPTCVHAGSGDWFWQASAGCNDRKSGGWFGQEAANPDAAARQQCADAGYEPGSVQFMQCMGGRGQPQE